MEFHTIDPVFDQNSRVLILGTFPSVKSREARFFYGHPQNRFWKVLSSLCDSPLPSTIEEKKAFLISKGIAVWDVIASCTITGSSDASIKDVDANDLTEILEKADVQTIAVNGKKALQLYMKYLYPKTGIKPVCLPSTSPANASWSLDKLIEAWSVLKPDLHLPDSKSKDSPDQYEQS